MFDEETSQINLILLWASVFFQVEALEHVLIGILENWLGNFWGLSTMYCGIVLQREFHLWT